MKPILKEEYSGYQCSEKSKPDQTNNAQSGYVVPVKWPWDFAHLAVLHQNTAFPPIGDL